jgi:hypothetical protein
MKDRKFRLVLACLMLATALLRFATAFLNLAFNYPVAALLDRKMG